VYTDKTLTCRECGQPFTFTAGEQEFYASRGLMNEPSRCPECRAVRRARNDGGGYSSGGGYSNGGSYGGGYERRERQMYPAVCSNCGKETQVPFEPRADRPVYCSDCFEQVRGRSSAGRSSGGGGSRW
jgi:CxxC-x17-CxxC domain-containing protein